VSPRLLYLIFVGLAATAQSHIMPRRPPRRGRSHPVQGDGSPNLGLADVMHLTCTDAVFGTHTALIDAFLAQTGLTLEPEPP